MADPYFSGDQVQQFLDTPFVQGQPIKSAAPAGRRAVDASGVVYQEGPDGQWRNAQGAAYAPPTAAAAAPAAPTLPPAPPADGGGIVQSIGDWFKNRMATNQAQIDKAWARPHSDLLLDVVPKAARDAAAGVAKLPWDIADAYGRGTQALGLGGKGISDLAQQESAAVDRVLPPRNAVDPVGNIASAVLQYGVPGTAAAKTIGGITESAPYLERLIAQAAGAGVSDAAVTDPGQKGNLTVGDMVGAGPTQTGGQSNLSARGSVAAESTVAAGTIQALVDAVARGLRGRSAPPPQPGAPSVELTLTNPPDAGAPAQPPGGAPLPPPPAPGAGRGAGGGAADTARSQPAGAGPSQGPAGPAIENKLNPWKTTPDGMVADPAGRPMKFGTQKQAANWILNVGNVRDGRQIFEIANHPDGGFAVLQRGIQEAPQPAAAAGTAGRPSGAPRERAAAGAQPAGGPPTPEAPGAPAAAYAPPTVPPGREGIPTYDVRQDQAVQPPPAPPGRTAPALPATARPTEAAAPAVEAPAPPPVQAELPHVAQERDALAVAADLGVPTHDVVGDGLEQSIADLRKSTAKDAKDAAGYRLSQWVKDQGGVRDPGGDIISAMGRTTRQMPGVIRAAGAHPDDLALRAWEHGFFPDHNERPTQNDFIDALSEDVNGRKVIRQDASPDQVDHAAHMRQLDHEFGRAGIDLNTMTDAEAAAALRAMMPEDVEAAFDGAGDPAWEAADSYVRDALDEFDIPFDPPAADHAGPGAADAAQGGSQAGDAWPGPAEPGQAAEGARPAASQNQAPRRLTQEPGGLFPRDIAAEQKALAERAMNAPTRGKVEQRGVDGLGLFDSTHAGDGGKNFDLFSQESNPHVVGQEPQGPGAAPAAGSPEAGARPAQEAGGAPGSAQHGSNRQLGAPAGPDRAGSAGAGAGPGEPGQAAGGRPGAEHPAQHASEHGNSGQNDHGPAAADAGPGDAGGSEGPPPGAGESMAGAGAPEGPDGHGVNEQRAGQGDGGRSGGVTLSANPFLNPAMLRHAAPDLIGGLVTGFADDWYNYGHIGITTRGFLLGFAVMSGLMHVPIAGRTVLGVGSHASAALDAVPGVLKKVPGGKYFHPTNGVTQDLFDKVQAMRVATRNWQGDAIKLAKEVQSRFTTAERALMSDVIERVDFPDKQGNVRPGGFAAADARIKAQAAALAQHAENIGQQLVNLGMMDQKVFDRLKGQYLHRYYDKHIDATEGAYKAQREAIKGDWSKRRGEAIAVAQPTGNRTPNIGDTITQMTNPVTGQVKYAQAADVAGLRAKGYVDGKVWTVDNLRGDKMDLWRDYTPLERRAMGEIRDASYRFARGTAEAAQDLAMGHLFQNIANDPKWASKTPVKGWIEVPTGNAAGTSIKKFGKLAGMWVDPEVMDALAIVRKPWTNTNSETLNNVVKGYLKALTVWKIGKTAYNPASHLNNVVSNIGMSVLGGITPMDAYKAAQAMRAAAPVVEEAKQAGLSLGTHVNIGDEWKGYERELGLLRADHKSGWAKMLEWFTNNSITKAYNNEDGIFKLAAYMHHRAKGLSPADAVKEAHSRFFDYSQAPMAVQAMRDIPAPIISSPFFTWNYFAAQRLIRDLAERPHVVAASLGVLSALGIGSMGLLYPNNPAGRSDYEQSAMPKYLQGGGPMEMRLPHNTVDPTNGEIGADYLNLRYLLPGGSMLDYTNNSSIGPSLWPGIIGGSPLGGNPLSSLMFGFLTGKDPYYNKDILPYPDADYFDPKTPTWQKIENWKASLKFAAYQILPPIATVPDRLGNAAVGSGAIDKDGGLAHFMGWTGQDFAGRQLSIERAIERIAGIKIDTVYPEQQQKFDAFADKKKISNATDALIKTLMNKSNPQKAVEDHIQAVRDAAAAAGVNAKDRERLREGAKQ